MPDTFVRPRCSGCQNVLRFEDFAAGGERCLTCRKSGVATVTIRGPRIRRPNARNIQPRESDEYDEQLLDAVPDELIEELVAALEAEASRLPASPASPVRGVLQELGVGRSARERHWAAWGFAGGFAVNVVLAKYAQMASGGSMAEFVGPLLIGGVLAGFCCAAIGWGLAKLQEPQAAT